MRVCTLLWRAGGGNGVCEGQRGQGWPGGRTTQALPITLPYDVRRIRTRHKAQTTPLTHVSPVCRSRLALPCRLDMPPRKWLQRGQPPARWGRRHFTHNANRDPPSGIMVPMVPMGCVGRISPHPENLVIARLLGRVFVHLLKLSHMRPID